MQLEVKFISGVNHNPTQFSFGRCGKNRSSYRPIAWQFFHIAIGATLYECYKEIERGQAGAILHLIWFDLNVFLVKFPF